MESHIFSLFVTYLVSHACNEIETSFIILREHYNGCFCVFIHYMYTYVPQDTYTHFLLLQIWLLCCTTTNSKKILLFGLVVMTSVSWEAFGKENGPVLSIEF